MNPLVIETETNTVIVIPKDAAPQTHRPHSDDGYTFGGIFTPFSDTVLAAVSGWRDGKTAAEIATAVGKTDGNPTDNGQVLLGAIRRVCPALLPPRHAPRRRHTS